MSFASYPAFLSHVEAAAVLISGVHRGTSSQQLLHDGIVATEGGAVQRPPTYEAIRKLKVPALRS